MLKKHFIPKKHDMTKMHYMFKLLLFKAVHVLKKWTSKTILTKDCNCCCL